MNQKVVFIMATMIAFSFNLKSQPDQKFLDEYNFQKSKFGIKSPNYDEYVGSPYLNKNFELSEIYLKDKTAYKLPLRFNIYKNSMEYKIDNDIFEIANPELINKIVSDSSTFIYITIIGKGGYFDLLVSGKCSLVKRYVIKMNEAQPPKPYQDAKPAEFSRLTDRFYLVLSNGENKEIKNLKDVLAILADKKALLEAYLKKEKIKNTKEENLVKITDFYNSL